MQYFKSISFLLLLFILGDMFAQVPEGGQRLNAENGTTYFQVGNCTITETTVTGQPFTEGLEVSVGSEINNSWDAQVRFPAIAGIEEGDVVLVAFYARTISSLEETGESRLNVIIELRQAPNTKELSFNISMGNEWKQYFAPAVVKNARATNDVSYLFHCGFPSQTFEIADVKFLNYKQTLSFDDLPQTEITYIGQDPEAAWRAPALERINQNRKGVVDIEVYDDQGELLDSANVSIDMIRHKFGFGTAIQAFEFKNNATYRNKVFENFNEVVFENDLKWKHFNPESSNTNLNWSINSLEKNNIPIRGHCIIWPSYRFTPSIVEDLSDDPIALRNLIDERIDDVTDFTKGRLIDWDVMNEPYSEHQLQDIFGDQVMADWYKRTRLNDRDAKLYINEYAIISAGGKNTTKQDYYYNIIEYIEEQGAQIDGIGMQGHMSSELTSIPLVYDIIDRFAALGKEIKITEHDINIKQRAVQAEYTRDFMTILFSHPSVKSLLVWGFWEDRHWTPDGALFNSDWTIRPHGESWRDMIYNQWWTNLIDTVTNEEGRVSLEGFLGTYEYTIESGGVSRSGEFSIDNSKASEIPNTVILTLDKTIPDHVVITPSQSPVLCEGEEITLQAPEGEGLEYNWHKNDVLLPDISSSITTSDSGKYTVTVKKGAVEIISPDLAITVNPLPPATTISSAGDLVFCPGNSVTLNSSITSSELNYDWLKDGERVFGEATSVEAKESGIYTLVTMSNGCFSNSLNEIEVTVLDPTDPSCPVSVENAMLPSFVYPNPFKGTFTVELRDIQDEASIELYNALGELVCRKDQPEQYSKYNFQVPGPGIYMLTVRDKWKIQTIRLIGL